MDLVYTVCVGQRLHRRFLEGFARTLRTRGEFTDDLVVLTDILDDPLYTRWRMLPIPAQLSEATPAEILSLRARVDLLCGSRVLDYDRVHYFDCDMLFTRSLAAWSGHVPASGVLSVREQRYPIVGNPNACLGFSPADIAAAAGKMTINCGQMAWRGRETWRLLNLWRSHLAETPAGYGMDQSAFNRLVVRGECQVANSPPGLVALYFERKDYSPEEQALQRRELILYHMAGWPERKQAVAEAYEQVLGRMDATPPGAELQWLDQV